MHVTRRLHCQWQPRRPCAPTALALFACSMLVQCTPPSAATSEPRPPSLHAPQPCKADAATMTGSVKCAWGDGQAVAQPAGTPADLTCSPPASVGAGQIELSVPFTPGAVAGEAPHFSTDAQVFSYYAQPEPKPGSGLVKVALCTMGGADGHSSLNDSLAYLRKAGELQVDLAVLPENFAQKHADKAGAMDPPPQPLDGPIIRAVSAVARQYSINVVAPIRQLTPGGQFLNSAVVIRRNGTVAGVYSKLFPVLGKPAGGGGEVTVLPSEQGVVAVDLDFGRISLAICFDINFHEVWQQAAALAPDIMVWPSAMHTPDPFTYGYARIHQMPIVAVGHPGDVVGKHGEQHATSNVSGFPLMKLATIDIDRTFVHWDFNQPQMKKLLAEQPAVEVEITGPPFWLLRSKRTAKDGGPSIRALIKQYGIETARDYALRSRFGLNVLRKNNKPVSMTSGPLPTATSRAIEDV